MQPFQPDADTTQRAIQPAFRIGGARPTKPVAQTRRRWNGRDFAADSAATRQEGERSRVFVMKLLKKLQNPFVLVGQGFVLGGILFFATHAESLLASPAAAKPAASLVASIAPAR